MSPEEKLQLDEYILSRKQLIAELEAESKMRTLRDATDKWIRNGENPKNFDVVEFAFDEWKEADEAMITVHGLKDIPNIDMTIPLNIPK